MTVFYYGINLAETEELSRHLGGQGLLTYFDLKTAVRALGTAATYAKIKARLTSLRYA